MRITLTRSGGVAGIRLHCSVDSEKLSARDARQLRTLLAAADLASACAARGTGRTADAFHYALATEEDGKSESFEFGEDVPEGVLALIAWLRKKAPR